MQKCRKCEREFDSGRWFCNADGELLKPDHLLKGRYVIKRRIGSGAMGFVYLAEHLTLDTTIAIKVLRSDPDTSLSLARQRFEREAKVIAGFNHENIIKVSDLDFENDYGFFVMDFLCGSTLQQKIADSSVLTLEFIADMTAQICSAIGYAHERGIIHRDLKPANIFIVENGEERAKVKVLDFGLLKILGPQHMSGTQSGSVLGTPYYMSPEQWDAREDIDSRADVYSLGVILYEMLSGKVPFDAENILELFRMHKEEEPRPMADSGRHVDPQIEAVVRKALSKKRNDRQPTAGQLAIDFELACQGRYLAADSAGSSAAEQRASETSQKASNFVNRFDGANIRGVQIVQGDGPKGEMYNRPDRNTDKAGGRNKK